MLTKLSGISFLAFVASAIVAHSACLKEADVQRHNADLKSHSENVGRRDGSVVSIYRQKGSARFVEVVRQNRCIATVKVLSADELDRKYDLMATLWDERAIAQEEGLDNEGMAEGDDTEVVSDIDLPFPAMDQFPVSGIYSGPIRPPDFKGRDRDFATFRTRISNGMKAGVNFSGQYAITQIGCGSSCSIAFVSDLKTGQQFRFPYGGEEAGPMTLKHSPYSRLLIATRRDGDECVLESMIFNAGTWDSLAKHPIGDSDACYEDIDDNISAFKSKREMSGANEFPASGTKSANADHPKMSTDEQPANVSPSAGMTEYDNINVAAMLDLYEAHDLILACFKARENQFPAYLSRQEMDKAEADFLRDEAEILKRDPRIDKQAVSRRAHELNSFFTTTILVNGMLKVNYEHRKACRTLAFSFPPGIENARLKKREKQNTGGGLIVPQDPRFR